MMKTYIECMENNSGYLKVGKWQTGWTSSTAHLVTGMASAHGNARYKKVTSNCGQSFNPGRVVDSQNVPAGIELCSRCQQGPKAQKAAKAESKICPTCGFSHRSTKFEICSGCREIASWSQS